MRTADANELPQRGRRGGFLALATISGARMFLGPALAVRRTSAGRGLRITATLLAAWELVFDKIPGVPARTSPPSLAGRAAAGALVGVLGRRHHGRGRALGAALVGAAAAMAGAFATLRERRALTRAFGGKRLSSALAGAVEDLTLLAIGRAALGPAPAR
jgi:uncharacterized membrane protein